MSTDEKSTDHSQDVDVESKVIEVRVVNLSNGIISARVQADKYVLTEEQTKALSEWSTATKQSGNASIGVEGVGNIGAGGSTEESKSEKEANETFRKYATELVKSGYQDIIIGDIIKINLQTPSKLHYVSIIQDGKEIRSNWSTTAIEIIVSDYGNISSNATFSVSNVIPTPSQPTLYQPIYQEYIKQCLQAFRKLYEIGVFQNKNNELLKEITVIDIIQRSVDFRSVNLATMKLLNIVKDDWLERSVKTLYNRASKAEIFSKNYRENSLLIKKISNQALDIGSCFGIASKWYYSLQGYLNDLESIIYTDVASDIDKMIDDLEKIVKDREIHDKDINNELHKIKSMPKATDDKSVAAKVDAVSKFRTLLSNKLQYKLDNATKAVDKAHRQMELSAISFIGGPLIGALVTGGFGIAYEVKKANYEGLMSAIQKSIKQASSGQSIESVLNEIAELASQVGELGKFCAIMASWFYGQSTQFDTWGQSTKTQAENIDKSWMNWSVNEFLQWLKLDARGNIYYNKYNDSISKFLNKQDNPKWIGSQLHGIDVLDLVMDWGIGRNDANDLLLIIQNKTGDAVESSPWKFWNVDDFVAWMVLQDNGKFSKYRRDISKVLYEKQNPDWNGLELQGIQPNVISDEWGIKDINDVLSLYTSINNLVNQKQVMVPINYLFWEQQYDNDVKFLETSKKDCENLITVLQKLNVDFAIKPKEEKLQPKTPSEKDYPPVKFGDYLVSVQKESETVM